MLFGVLLYPDILDRCSGCQPSVQWRTFLGQNYCRQDNSDEQYRKAAKWLLRPAICYWKESVWPRISEGSHGTPEEAIGYIIVYRDDVDHTYEANNAGTNSCEKILATKNCRPV